MEEECEQERNKGKKNANRKEIKERRMQTGKK